MSALRGAVGGALALTLLEATVSSSDASARVGGWALYASRVITRLVDPTVPLIPDRRKPNKIKPLAL